MSHALIDQPILEPEGPEELQEDEAYDKPYGADMLPPADTKPLTTRRLRGLRQIKSRLIDAEWKIGQGKEDELTADMLANKLRAFAFQAWGDTVQEKHVVTLQLKALELLCRWKGMLKGREEDSEGDGQLVAQMKEAEKNVERIKQNTPTA